MSASWLLDAPLIEGYLPFAVTTSGMLGVAVLLTGPRRRWWTRVVPVALIVGGVAAGLSVLAVVVLRPFPDMLPTRILLIIGGVAAAGALAVAHGRGRWWRRVIALLAATAVLAAGVVKVNSYYGYRPTLGSILGVPFTNQVELASLPARGPIVTAPAGRPMSAVWHAPAGQPATGRVAEVPLPGVRSGFAGRDAWLYLPPAYLGSRRADLPVVVLIPGQPGGPQDWLLAGLLAEVADQFAAGHDGLAPIVLMPDSTGSGLGNPLCLDSRLGNAETYLAVDVPAWISTHLQVSATTFAIGGFSFGGTCGLQLALRRPEVYPTFLDISGQTEPTLGDHDQTVRAAFGGDENKFAAVNPIDELQVRRYAEVAGYVAVAAEDADYRPDDERMTAALRADGVAVTFDSVPGPHSWPTAVQALRNALPWLCGRTGLLPHEAGSS